MPKDKIPGCTSCGTTNCSSLDKIFPPFCPTQKFAELNEQTLQLSATEELILQAAAEIEGEFYKKATRIQEIILFAQKIKAKKIGIATCKGLLHEAKIFSKILTAQGIEHYSVICKVGANDKTCINLDPKYKINKGSGHETMCNPILQAKILNQEKTDLNVVIGLCVGHDSLFYKHSDALVTTLITKDRVLGHNPVAALYTAHSYYSHLEKDKI